MGQILKNMITVVLGFRVDQDQRNRIKAQADKYTKGNISEWCRFAAMNMEPRPSDLVELQVKINV